MEEKDNTRIKGCDTLPEREFFAASGANRRSLSSEESYSSEEVDSSTDYSLNSSISTSSSNSGSEISKTSTSQNSSSPTETKSSLLESSTTTEKSPRRNSSNYREAAVGVPALIAPTTVDDENNGGVGGGDVAFSNEQNNKLSEEEKARIRKLRRKLAAATSATAAPDKEPSFDKGNKDCDKPTEDQQQQQQQYQHHHWHHHPNRRQRPLKERKKNKNFVGYKMFGKLSCVSCVDALRDCCGVANDEPTNGVKILRRKDPPVDLQTDLPTLSNVSVVQRLKLILEKLESGQLDSVPPEVLQKNIQYAIEVIQDEDAVVKDRGAPSDPPHHHHEHPGDDAPSPLPPSVLPPPGPEDSGSGGEGATVNNLAHVSHQPPPPPPPKPKKPQVSQEPEKVPHPPPHHPQRTTTTAHKRQSPTSSCVVSSAAILTASAVTDSSSAELTFLPQNTNLSSSAAPITDKNTIPVTTTPTSTTTTGSTDPLRVTVDSEPNTTLVGATTTTGSGGSSSGGGGDTNAKNDTTTTTPTPPITTATTTTAPIPTIITPPKTDRKGSIAGAAGDTLTVPEKPRREESDNELSEVDEEVIPEEVRKWLASTFTKTVQVKPRLEPRPRFRSVANAIRVGLFVDRFYRQLSATTLEIPADVQQHLKEVNNWHFDIFRLHDKSSGHSLKYVGKELFSRYGIVSRFRINLDKLESYLTAVEFGYTKLKNPYHNDIHAADVTQTLHYFIGSSGLANMFTDLEIFSLLFAALIHDFEHTGRTNNFHVNVGTELALLYNDRSVLENHHVSAAFRLLKDEDKSILTNLKPEEFRDFRNLVIEMVLSTDMSTHFAQIKNVRAILNGEKVPSTTTMALMSLLLHTADISHPAKPWKLHKKFADTILEEFFLQGDEEAKLGLPFSPLCDRSSVAVPESQIGFIEFIVEPSLNVMTDLIDFVLNVDESSSGPTPLTAKPADGADPKNSKIVTKPSDNSSNAVNNNNNSKSSNDTASTDSSATSTVSNNSDNNSASAPSGNKNNNNNATPVSRVPPPVPSRQGKSQIKPFQNLTPGEDAGAPRRRTESENCIKTAAAATPASNNSSGDTGGKIPLSSRTPSFPLQGGANHNYGPVLRPWINHLVENKAKWRMISAEAASAAAANAASEENS